MIMASLVSVPIGVNAPDPDLVDPELTTQDGEKIKGAINIAVKLAKTSDGSSIAPATSVTQTWLDLADLVMKSSASWLEPTCHNPYTSQEREANKFAIEAALTTLEARLAEESFLVSPQPNVADLSVLCAVLPLFQTLLGKQVQATHPSTLKWLAQILSEPAVSKVLGAPTLSQVEGSWVLPAAVSASGSSRKKKKKSGKEDGAVAEVSPTPARDGPQADEELDPEKAAKKAAKLAEKEAKKAKAAAKAAAAEEKKAAAAAAGPNEKKAKAKAEADAKKQAEAEEVAALIAAARSTPPGEKKDTSAGMFRSYNPRAVESAWYEWWEKCGFFKPDPDSTKEPFVIVIPPPNVTGALHIGHALTNAVQDTVVRWRRMSGYNALWVPGTDHAGIATQTVVEKKLQREKKVSRHDLGRDAFLSEVHSWVDEYGGRICDQLRRIGSSVDWDRKVFTMDAKLSRSVKEAFVRMHGAGIVYRDNRLVNWCCRLKTAVSDIEVDYIDLPRRTLMSVPGYSEPVEFGVITSFAYPIEGEGGEEIVVATTRPETMLGDTAVAVHPEDPRYTHLHGKFAVHPVSGRRIPIICDAELVDMSFGTGAVKVTPAHDPNDFATGKRHNLEFINILDDDGNMNQHCGQFQGEPRFKTRVTIVEFLKSKGLFRGVADNAMRLGLCSRSKDVIEPLLKPQWWVDCKDMAARSVAAVREGDLQILPKEFESVWFRWLENIRDWCISRQLWWGHRIPAYYVRFAGEDAESGGGGRPGLPSEDMTRWVVGRDEEEAMKAAREKYPDREVAGLVQDEDVLDTWFSSGLFPFSVFGWPEDSVDLRTFFPTTLLETGHDILFFWVARMVMMSLQLQGCVPFKQVYLHAMVRDAHGRKMSKSLGNVIDPLHVIEGISLAGLHATLDGGNLDAKEVAKARQGQAEDFPEGIEECGTDALRFALVAYTAQGRDINLDIKRVVAYRHWCNKLWNATRFAMMHLPPGFTPSPQVDAAALPPDARWILSRLNNATEVVVKALEEYNFSTATQRAYAYWQYELCDVFIELIKPVMAAPDDEPAAAGAKRGTREALWLALDCGLRLLHPFMPFVTEELWQRLPRREDQAQYPSIMLAPYPAPVPAWSDPVLEREVEQAMSVVNALRGLRNDYGLTRQRPAVYIVCTDEQQRGALSRFSGQIATLSTSSGVSVSGNAEGLPQGCGIAIVDAATTAHMALKGVLDPALELQKLERKLAEVEKRALALRGKMSLAAYVEKTPEAVQCEDAERLAKAEAEAASAAAAMEDMKRLALEDSST